jgi:hypothetical protein
VGVVKEVQPSNSIEGRFRVIFVFQFFYFADNAPLLGIIIKYFPPLYSAADTMMECTGGIYAGFPFYGQPMSMVYLE